MGLMFISASLERIILFLYPTLTVIASSLLYKQKLDVKSLFAIFLSYGGTVLVMLQEHNNAPIQGNFWLGTSFVFASAVAFAGYLLLTPPLIKKIWFLEFHRLSFNSCLYRYINPLHFKYPSPVSTPITTSLKCNLVRDWLRFFSHCLTYVMLMQSIERLGASQSAMIASIGPVLTILLAVVFLNEHLNMWQWVGCFLNIVGVMMITLRKKRLKH